MDAGWQWPFMGEEVTQLLLDKRSETTEPHCTIQLHSIIETTLYHCVNQVDTMSYHRYTVYGEYKKIPKLYHNVCFILYHIWPRGQKASGWPALPSF